MDIGADVLAALRWLCEGEGAGRDRPIMIDAGVVAGGAGGHSLIS